MGLDFLMAVDWISPQIDFLLILQYVRDFWGGKLDNFLLSITTFGEYLIPAIICSVVYWCIDTKKGIYLFMLLGLDIYFTQLFKMIACVYRPWVLNPKVVPPKAAMLHAGGYSFPSGHSATAAFFGGVAFLVQKKKIPCICLIVLILLVGFSRMFLGVHTPQDVLAGLSIGTILVFALNYFVNYLEKNPKRYLISIAVFDIIFIVTLIYVIFKSYPIDYLNGKILVNSHKAICNSLVSFGLGAGFLNGICLYKKFIDVDVKNTSLTVKLLRAVVGVILIFVLFHFYNMLFGKVLDYKLILTQAFLTGFFITFIYPLSFKLKFKR